MPDSLSNVKHPDPVSLDCRADKDIDLPKLGTYATGILFMLEEAASQVVEIFNELAKSCQLQVQCTCRSVLACVEISRPSPSAPVIFLVQTPPPPLPLLSV